MAGVYGIVDEIGKNGQQVHFVKTIQCEMLEVEMKQNLIGRRQFLFIIKHNVEKRAGTNFGNPQHFHVLLDLFYIKRFLRGVIHLLQGLELITNVVDDPAGLFITAFHLTVIS